MRSTTTFGICTALFMGMAAMTPAQEKERTISVTLTVPSTAYKLQIREIYQTQNELWVLSTVKGGGIGLQVITKRKDQVKVKAPKLPVKHFIVGKTWNWTQEKDYTYLKSRQQFEKMAKKANAMRIYQRKAKAKKGAKRQPGTKRYIVMYNKNIFTNGKTKEGLTLGQLAQKHAKQFNGKFGRLLKIINGYTIDLKPDMARKLSRLPEVRNVEEDRPVGIGLPRK